MSEHGKGCSAVPPPTSTFIEYSPPKRHGVDPTMFVSDGAPSGKQSRKRVRSSSVKKLVTDLCKDDALSEGVELATLDYADHELGDVRIPDKYAVPSHIVEQFDAAFPNGIRQPGRKEKCCLKPKRVLKVGETGKLAPIYDFWTPETLSAMIPVILKQHDMVTLTVIDFFCVHYSLNNKVKYELNKDDIHEFYVKDDYDNCIKSDTREYFDVYARKNRILIEFAMDKEPIVDTSITWSIGSIRWDNKKLVGVRFVQGRRMCYLITSVGQLKHFYWSISNKVLDYCINNKQQIAAAHKLHGKDESNKRKKSSSSEEPSSPPARGAPKKTSPSSFLACKRSISISCDANQLVKQLVPKLEISVDCTQ